MGFRRLQAALGATVLLAAWPAAAQSPGELIEELARRLDQQDARIRQLEAQLASARGGAARTGSAVPPLPPTSGAPSEEVTIKLRGRLQVDALLVNGADAPVPTPTGTQVRRFNLGAEGRLGSAFRYSAEANFGGGRTSLEDIFLAYQPSAASELVIGYTKPPNVMDELTSDNLTPFLERSAYATGLGPGRRVGVAGHVWGSRWGLRAGLYGERDDAALDVARSESWLASARLHGDLLADPAQVLHLAASSYYTRLSSSDPAVRITQRPEANRAVALLDTGSFAADDGVFAGIEVAYASGPLTLQGEGGFLDYRGPDVSPRFWGYSVQAAWRWTGEARPYDARQGAFGRVTPRRAFPDGGIGAIETGVRLARLDLDDGGVTGGRLTSYAAVLNWFPLSRIRLSGNFIRAHHVTAAGVSTDQNIFALRGQVDW